MIVKPGHRNQLLVVLLLLSVGLVVSLFLAGAFGAVNIQLVDVFRIMLSKITVFDFPSSWQVVDETIIFQVRLPRVIGSAQVGAALATAGVLF